MILILLICEFYIWEKCKNVCNLVECLLKDCGDFCVNFYRIFILGMIVIVVVEV